MARRAILLAVAACGGSHAATPTTTDITAFAGDAAKVAIGDLDGDGKPELVFADKDRLWVTSPDGKELASTSAPGGIQLLVVGDGVIYAGWGQTREHMDAPPRIDAYRLAGPVLSDETVTAPQSERAEIAAIVPEKGGALIAWYASKYMVTSAHATPGAGGTWAIAPIATIRMATSYAEGAAGLVVGRAYGDSIDQPGDAFVLAPDGTRTAIPTTRGVHGLAIAPDGAVWLGDGWDRDYGHNAHALLTRCFGAQCTQIEDVAGNYWIAKLAFVDAGDVIAMGNTAVREYRGAGTSWTGTTIAGTVRDVAVGPDGSIVIVGDKSQLIRGR